MTTTEGAAPPATGAPVPRHLHAEFMQIWEEGYVSNQISFEAMHTQMVLVLEGGPLRRADGVLDRERILRHLEAATSGIDLFRVRLMRGVLGLTPPAWVPDDRFDIHRHVLFGNEVLELTTETLPELTTATMAPMSLRHPLWRFKVTELTNGDVALGAVFHHASADGLGAMKILAAITDNAPDAHPRSVSAHWSERKAPAGPIALPFLALRRWLSVHDSPAAAWRDFRAKPLRRRIRRVGGRVLRPFRDARSNRPSERVRELPVRHSAFATLDSAQVARRAESLGGTLSDLLAAAVMRASHGDVRLRFPVSTRAPGELARNRVWDMQLQGSAAADLGELIATLRAQIDHRDDYARNAPPLVGRQIGYITVLPWRSRPRYLSGARVVRLVPFPASLPRDELSAGGVLYDGGLTVTLTMQAQSDVAGALRDVTADLLGTA